MITKRMWIPLVLALFAACATFSQTGNPQVGWGVAGFVGRSSTEAAPGVTVELLDQGGSWLLGTVVTDFFGRYEFARLRPGQYLVRVATVTVPVTLGEQDLRLDIDLSNPTGAMNYVRIPPASAGAGGGAAAPAGPTDPALMQAFAARYWGFSGAGIATGGTERRMTLCPGGTFTYGSESGYSGGAGTWGTAAQSGSSGRWSIQGSQSEGTITLSWNGGKVETLRYRQGAERGCYTFNGNLMCHEGPANCQ